MKKHLSTILIIAVFLLGLSLLLYPTVSDYVNSRNQTRVITKYAEDVAQLDKGKCEELWNSAVDYNAALAQKSNQWAMSEQETQQYEKELQLEESGVMGYIDIPKIRCYLPIYHGVDEGTLQTSIGHMPGSSLPVGGASTHCVLSGHRGLPSAKLFSNLDMLVEGDQFMIRTLDAVLTYEVDQILIVLPDEISALNIEEEQDYCTLVTCTPYGVNSHRMLVRGHRVENAASGQDARVTADAIQIEPVIVASIAGIVFLFLFLIYTMVRKPRKKS